MNEKSFETLGLSQEMMRAIADAGYTEMTDIQANAIPLIMKGRDIIGQSSTGTGKTAAFGIPVVERITDLEVDDPQALILCPTRELAMQVSDEIRKFSKYKDGMRVVAIYGGQNIDTQIRALSKSTIVVGTPGRIIDHLKRKTLSLKKIKFVVLDEADEMLDMGFLDDIRLILNNAPDERQTALFSATMPAPILRISQRFQKSPELIKGDDGQTAFDLIEQFYCEVPKNKKSACAGALFRQTGAKRGLIFCNTKIMVDLLTARLCEGGLAARSIHGDMPQGARTKVMEGFKSGEINLLVATDVAARGIDATDVEIIINYDIPEDQDFYVHRIGRTGRAGKQGASYTLIAGSGEFFDMAGVQEKTGIQMKEYILEGVDALPEDRRRAMPERRERPSGGGGRGRGAPSGSRGTARPAAERPSGAKSVLMLDVGTAHDVSEKDIVDSLIRYGGMRKSDIGKVDIGELSTSVQILAEKAQAVQRSMAEDNATVDDFIVACTIA